MKILRLPDVIELTGLSRMSIYRKESEGQFPRRRRLGLNAVGWLEDEVTAWIQTRPTADVAATPISVFLSRRTEPVALTTGHSRSRR